MKIDPKLPAHVAIRRAAERMRELAQQYKSLAHHATQVSAKLGKIKR